MNDSKPTNPKDILGSSKLPLHLVSPAFKAFTSIGLMNGALKYGRANWRAAGVKFSIYYDALNRHMDDLLDGEWDDPDDMVPHLCAAAACLNIIVDAFVTGKLIDDRNFVPDGMIGMRKAIERLTPHVDALKRQHADKSPKHWTIADNGLVIPSLAVNEPLTGDISPASGQGHTMNPMTDGRGIYHHDFPR